MHNTEHGSDWAAFSVLARQQEKTENSMYKSFFQLQVFPSFIFSLIEAAVTVALLGLAGTKRDLSDGKSFPIV